jgi:hypothetical protein
MVARTLRYVCHDARGLRAGATIAVPGGRCAERRPIVAAQWEPRGIIDISDDETLRNVRDVLAHLESIPQFFWGDVFAREIRFAVAVYKGDDVDALKWKWFLQDHPELSQNDEVAIASADCAGPPARITSDEIYVALEAAVATKNAGKWGNPGLVRSSDVGRILWPDVQMHGHGKPTRAQLRVAQALARLVREGRAIRYRSNYGGCNFWTTPNAEVNEAYLGSGYKREEGGSDA